MTTLHPPVRRPFLQRLFYAIPVIGWVARDVAEGDAENLYYAIALFAMLWALSVIFFGIPGLYIPALILVPVVWVILLLITTG